uniref:DNA polymerase n=1 Tax=Bat mastadenovirus TaxID=740971 RepID=A0A894JE33_9ADEN|nr:DNA polymerase [Bat mastadenovirus]
MPESMLNLNVENVYDIIPESKASMVKIVNYYKGKLKTTILKQESNSSLGLQFLIKKNTLYLIKELQPVKKCEYCGSYYKSLHTCSVRRRDFYFHHINSQSCDWWEKISFTPIGSPPETKRLYIVYDIETYTWHGKFGKQLVPFMLVFSITGDEALTKTAKTIAEDHGWQNSQDTFYLINPNKTKIGTAFKKYRDALHNEFTYLLWSHFIEHNPELITLQHNLQLERPEDITQQDIQKAKIKLKGKPLFLEIYVIGHNINGFDEIVIAAQTINNRNEVPAIFKISRNFMPRNGKILFNDITYSLPNPCFVKRKNFENWEMGMYTAEDNQQQFVKFMVRDTFALTHTSLRNAATAYNLKVSKGCCPYKAVNSFYMLGYYLSDADGFPAEQYWNTSEEYSSNKQLWKETGNGTYDIIQETLKYCITDVLVTVELVKKLQESYQAFIEQAVNLPGCYFNIFQRPTISSNSHAIFKQIVYRAEKPQQGNLNNILLAPSSEMYDYVRASIRGGRCYPTYIGVLTEPIYVYDICGMYASALTHPMPSGQPLNPYEKALAVRQYELKLQTQTKIDYFDGSLLPGIFTIDADAPPEEHLDVLPPFCSKKGGRLCWTNENLRSEVATSIDVITLHNRGWKVKIIPDDHSTVFPEWKCIAKEYVELNIQAKEKADKEKNQTIRSIAKLLSNALYGSFATKLENKKILFSDQINENLEQEIARGEQFIKSSSFIETENFCEEIMPEFVAVYPPVSTAPTKTVINSDEEYEEDPFIDRREHVTYTYQPITFLDVEDDDLCLHTVEKVDPRVENNRYPSQIASFVLAWTRAFVSEWCEFLYKEDRGKPFRDRKLKSVYGDTDSIFMTELGKHLMETEGKKRLKKHGGPLVFNPDKPELTWLVECETQCSKCGADAYASESVFLAPKLYALKDTICTKCKNVGKGKLRAKGHYAHNLCYEIMKSCYYSDVQQGTQKFQTSRTSIKRTLVNSQPHVQPFTVTETTLTRTLRPWKDKTLREVDHHHLLPYSNAFPNPRNREVTWMEFQLNNCMDSGSN